MTDEERVKVLKHVQNITAAAKGGIPVEGLNRKLNFPFGHKSDFKGHSNNVRDFLAYFRHLGPLPNVSFGDSAIITYIFTETT